MFNKQEWMKSLQIGDTVCDCSFRHQRIFAIANVCKVHLPNFMRTAIFANIETLLPDWLFDRWLAFRDNTCKYFYGEDIVDKDLILENGNHCSAMHCCDPADHEEKHPDLNV